MDWGKCYPNPHNFYIHRQFLPLIFCCLLMSSFSISPFWRPKGCKRHSAEKNQLLAPRLTNFRKRKYCLRRTSAALAYNCKQACILLAGTNFASFVVRLPAPFLCKSRERQVWPHLRCVRKLATLFRDLLQPAPVIFTALYFF